ncbi:Lactoylglutathione lyase [Obelidium mucronatum]|nr:Lactoylglutathione lyase [Obelidium mucronatum]
MKLGHISIPCTDLQSSKAWYSAVLAPIGGKVLFEGKHEIGYGKDEPILWLLQAEEGYNAKTSGHVCFQAENRFQVDEFYKEAINAGGEDNGAPGLRPHYNAEYYAAFVRDLDGRNVEFVTFAAEE